MESDFTNGDIMTATSPEKQNGHCVESTTKETATTTCRIYELEEVRQHASEDNCWVINNNSVYDVTSFLQTHPGGAELVLNHAGADITHTLRDEDLHMHSVHAFNLLKEYKIGELPPTEGETYNSDTDNKDLSGFKEDLVDWDKGLVFQVHRFGHDYLRWVHSPVHRKLKLFDSEFIEFFSKTKWYMIPLVWIPIVTLCSIYSYGELTQTVKRLSDLTGDALGVSGMDETGGCRLLSIILFVLLFLVGIPLWTLMEYGLHRYVFHMEPRGDSPFMITMHFFFHGQHHKVPFDEDRLVFPPAAAAVFVLAFYKLLVLLLPGGIGSSAFCGGLVGYIVYDLLHYYMHHGAPERGSYLHDLKRYHVMHHFNDPNTGFGISTKFWDRPFNTFNKKLL